MYDGVDSRVVEVLRYLVAKVMAGEDYVVKGLYDYVVKGLSPAIVVARYERDYPWMSKYTLRGWYQRLRERASEGVIYDVLRKTYHLLLEIENVYEETDKMTLYRSPIYVCRICGADIPKDKLFVHVRYKHRNAVDTFVLDIIDKVRNGWVKKRVPRA